MEGEGEGAVLSRKRNRLMCFCCLSDVSFAKCVKGCRTKGGEETLLQDSVFMHSRGIFFFMLNIDVNRLVIL